MNELSRELAALHAIGQAVNASLSLEDTSIAALRSMLEAARPDLAFLFRREGERLILQEALPPTWRSRLGAVPEHRVGECICGLAAREGRPIYSRDIASDSRCSWEECKQADLKSFAALPLRSGEEVFGIIGLASATERDFESQAGFLETMAQQVSTALANARLYTAARQELEERKRTQEALRISEERLRLALKSARQGLYDLNILTGATQVSAEYATMLGHDPAEFHETNAAWIERLHPEDRAPVAATFREYLAGRIPEYRVEFRQRAKSGDWKWILSLGQIVARDGRGEPLRMLGTHTDITERKRAEQALQDNERKYRELVENANCIIERWNPRGEITFMNEFGLAFFGFSEDEIVGRHLVGTIVPQSESTGRDLALLMERICADPKPYELNVNENMRRDGSRVWIAWTNKAVVDPQGRLVEIFSVGTDITERKRAEDALRESEARFATFMAHLPGFAFLKDHDRQVLFVNERFESDFGLPKGSWIGKTNDEIWPGEVGEKIRRDDEAVLSGGEPHAIIEVVPTRGELRTYRTIKFPIPRPGGKPWLGGIAVDITDLKRTEEEKERLQAQLLQAQKMESVGRLAGGVAHDFNNMLQAILGHVELGLMRSEPAHPVRANLEAIGRAAGHSADLTRQLLAFARKQTVAPQVLDLNDVVAGMLKMLRRPIGEDIDLAWIPGADLWPLRIDPVQIDQILANLCVNARDAIDGVGRITIETENVTLDAAYCASHPDFAPGHYIVLAVSDDGCGMTPEVMAHLFEPFFTTKGVGRGTGLGLATVYGIVRQNEGMVNVYSEPGKGSTFKLYLPRYEGVLVECRAAAPLETPRGSGETVLLVEDEAAILELGQEMLEALGYRVLTAATPLEAIRKAAAHSGPIHLLITDVVMPGMNGHELSRRLVETQPGLGCLFMSGYTANVIAHRGILDEGVHFLQKPFAMQALAIKVREALRGG